MNATVAFSNVFQRPALQGGSLEPEDVAVANAVFEETMRMLNPGAVVFISGRAW